MIPGPRGNLSSTTAEPIGVQRNKFPHAHRGPASHPFDAIRQTVTTGQNLVRSRLRDQPYATLLAAAGVGYVLGGGLPRIPVRLLLGLGGRLAYGALMTQLLHALADNSGRHFADR